jgi:hypothetical protein
MAGWVLVFFIEFFQMQTPIRNVLSSKLMPSVHERLFKALSNSSNLTFMYRDITMKITNYMHYIG